MHLLFGFSGRIGRGQWWLAQLALLLLLGVGGLAFVGLGPDPESPEGFTASSVALVAGFVVLLAWINIAATVKRYHDRNKSGYWFLVTLVPYIGTLWQLAECGFFAGTPGSNDYGSPNGAGRSLSLDDLDIEGVATAARSRPRVEAVSPPAAAPARPALGRRPATTGFGRRTAF